MDPDPDPSTRVPRKVKFTPKAPPRRRSTRTNVLPKPGNGNDDAAEDEAATANLRRRVVERLGKGRPKIEKKPAVHVAFSHDAASTNLIRTFGKPKDESEETSNIWNLEDSAEQVVMSSASTGRADVEESTSSANRVIASSKKKPMYREPWDYERTYYPTVLPLRRPYSGDPELVDKEEFGGGTTTTADLDNENAINSALELGLLCGEEETDERGMIFLQLPRNLPIEKQVGHAAQREKGKEKAGGGTGTGSSEQAIKGGLEGMPAGYMGKMLVYKSGAVKLKLGDKVFDVSASSSCTFAQDVAMINTVDKHVCRMGELVKRAVVTPDIHSLL